MSLGNWNRLGVVLASHDANSAYYLEALEFAGLPYKLIERLESGIFHDFDTLLFCGYGEVPQKHIPDLSRFLADGKSAVFSGSAWGVERTLGLKPVGRHTSVGTIRIAQETRFCPSDFKEAKYFGGTAYFENEAESIAATVSGETLLSRYRTGKGMSFFFGPHVGNTISMVQFGRSVETDGVSPLDGSAKLDDGILRAEDGIILSFETDRHMDPSSASPHFAVASSDRIREIWIRTVVAALEAAGKPFVMTWPWPNEAQSIAMLTVDCPQPKEETFRNVSRVISNIGGRPAWMISHPGLPQDLYRNIRGALQEVGLLLNVASESDWDPEKARIQHVSLTRSSAFRHVDAIRAENGKWEGYLQPYETATRSGSRLFVSKGGRQPGTSGFCFGSCYPTSPWKRDGSRYNVFELPYQAFVPGFPDSAAEAVLTEVINRNGCFHIAADLNGITQPAAQSTLHRLILMARQSNLRFTLPSEIAHHQTMRRALRIAPFHSGESSGFHATAIDDVEGMSFLIGGVAELIPSVGGNPVRGRVVQRYGTNLWAMSLNMESKRTVTVEATGELLMAA